MMKDCLIKAVCYNYSDVACNLISNPERECGFYQTLIKRLSQKLECDTCDRAPYSCSTCGIRLEKEYDWEY